MEAAIRWSPHSPPQRPEFLIIDVEKSRLKLCSINSLGPHPVKYKVQSQRDRLPNFTAFDWSKTEPDVVAIGAASGEAHVIRLSPGPQGAVDLSFPIKHQRKCNSIAFSGNNYLATGLERVRNDNCMNVYDLNHEGTKEPFRKLAMAEAITSIKFFGNQPEIAIAGVYRQCIRIYDLRDSSPTSSSQFATRHVHNLAIDPLDENYFISAGPMGEPVVSVWDRRFASRSTSSTPDAGPPGPVLEIRPAVDARNTTNIWSLRFSGLKAGAFAVLSNSGELRFIELAQHQAKSGLGGPVVQNTAGGTPWTSNAYVRRTHTLAWPDYDPERPVTDKTKVMAWDFLNAPQLYQGHSVLLLHPNRDVGFRRIHDIAPKLNFTGADEVMFGTKKLRLLKPDFQFDTSTEELIALQDKAKTVDESSRRTSDQAIQASASRMDKLSLENFGHKAPPSYESPHYPSSGDKHEDLLSFNFPKFVPDITTALNLENTYKRRCKEGYRMDPLKNMQIIANDPWLVDMWDIIRRLDDMAKDGMYYEYLDLSYLGVHAIWTRELGNNRNRIIGKDTISDEEFNAAIRGIVEGTSKHYPPFNGHPTRYPEARQLCLAVCGWAFTKERLRQRCRMLMENGQHYKAIVVAVMRGFKDLAQELLKSAIQQKIMHNIGLGAVIACEHVTEEQREMCSWMAEETEDPYLKALLAYFVSGDWKTVADMPALPLSDRIGVAVKYLDDERLTTYLKMQTASACVSGNTEGLVLTGLSDRALELFHHYFAKFEDLQTAVLALSFAHPLYCKDERFDMWRESYLWQMQVWRTYLERVSYTSEHAKRSKAKTGQRFGNTPARPAAIRCAHCYGALAHYNLRSAADVVNLPQAATSTAPDQLLKISPSPQSFSNTAAGRSGLLCPLCGRHVPHCGICGLLIGTADPSLAPGVEEHPLGRNAITCMACGHCFHSHHALDWYSVHKECPVPSCHCICGLLH
jgi:WD40 repeat protein